MSPGNRAGLLSKEKIKAKYIRKVKINKIKRKQVTRSKRKSLGMVSKHTNYLYSIILNATKMHKAPEPARSYSAWQ